MNTSMQVEYLLQDLRFAINEAKKQCNGARPIIRMAADTHDDIWCHLQRRSTGWGDTGAGPESFKRFMGCDIEIECSWVYGVAVAVEELSDALHPE